MNILLELDLLLILLLFTVAGTIGMLVRIDRWVEGHVDHPKSEDGKLEWVKVIVSYISTFILSGIAGAIVAMSTSYFSTQTDSNILLFIAIMIGAIGKLIFYNLVEWVHIKFNANFIIPKKKVSMDQSHKHEKEGK